MSKKCDLSELNCGLIVGARLGGGGVSVSETELTPAGIFGIVPKNENIQ